MASEKQPLPLRVLPCAHQDSKARVGTSKDDIKPPPVALFRNNLIALSQYRNLLFVAYLDEVYVYTPSFPEQTTTTKPELVIHFPRSRSGLRGYMDPSKPHAANHLIVGDIGDEEVLVIACDDGDVISYTVRSIALAIEVGAKTVYGLDVYEGAKLRRSGRQNLILPIPDWDSNRTNGRLLAPWFLENVGATAWGLATHKRKMLLAVSSNSKEIIVFTPSLNPEQNGDSHWTDPALKITERYTAWENKDSIAVRDRSLGRKVTLKGHTANIPNIAFCDNDLDPEGRYLASTDIDGYTFIWDIWRGTQILVTLGKNGPHTRARGWAVACLDPRASRLSDAPVNTFGCACRVNQSNTLIDNSEAIELVQNNSQWHPGWIALSSVVPNGEVALNPQTVVQAAAATTTDQALQVEDEGEDEGNEEMIEIGDFDDDFDDDAMDEGEAADFAGFGQVLIDGSILESHAAAAVPSIPVSLTLDHTEAEQLLSDSDSLAADEDSEPSDHEEMLIADHTDQQTDKAAGEGLRILPPDIENKINRSSDTTHAKSNPKFLNLPFNLLQTDEGDIHLLRDITFDVDLTEIPPGLSNSEVLCRQALTQQMPPGHINLGQMQRLNMIAQIPELGVVAIGNQVGRVGILTMTRWEAQRQSGFKLECILPLRSEEEKEMRPKRPLMGMAVGPVQGMETPLPRESPRVGARRRRRFRLLMMYCDHTVLSYEISRSEGDEDVLVV